MVKRKDNEESLGGASIPPELQAAWIRHLRWFFDFYNGQYLRHRLRPPVFQLGSASERLGQWDPKNRVITISQMHILEHRWESVLDTLRHEMAHQYVNEVMNLGGAPPHGKPFVEACRLLRCDAQCCAESEQLQPLASSDTERDKILARVRELLALADSPNEHEAANAMRMAERYLLKYNLTIDEARGAGSYVVRCLGRCSSRVQEFEYSLSNLLQEHFFVLVLWTFSYDPQTDRLGRVLQISGTLANVEVADYVHTYLMELTDSLWNEQKKKPRGLRGRKLEYLAGLMRGFRDKLDRQKWELKKEYGLVWRGDSELEEFYKHLNPSTVSGRAGGVSRGSGFHDGVQDGQRINIRRPIDGSVTDRGRALPGG